ncbi:hypothetical protein FJZ20_01990 [Candidatus Pacearchaeota archaeon]|nr:hypothetical protein [Candidatus Pacearchaeota archaeon]
MKTNSLRISQYAIKEHIMIYPLLYPDEIRIITSDIRASKRFEFDSSGSYILLKEKGIPIGFILGKSAGLCSLLEDDKKYDEARSDLKKFLKNRVFNF